MWSQLESHLHINHLWMRGCQTSPLSLQHSCSGSIRQFHQKSGGGWGVTRSWSLWKRTECLFSLAITHNISIRARFIPGRMNVIANDLSKARQIRICLPSPTNSSAGHPKVQTDQPMSCYFGGFLLVKTDMVCGPSEVDPGKTHSSPPPHAQMLKQPKSNFYNHIPGMLNLHEWKLSSPL